MPKSCTDEKDCPAGQYCEVSDHKCQGCHTDCTECLGTVNIKKISNPGFLCFNFLTSSGPGFDQCTICKNGQPLDSRTRMCLPCHAGQYYNSDSGVRLFFKET